MIETQSHRAALDSLLAMANLFFARLKVLPQINLRLFPVVIGPTGVGKSFLVETAARELKADYFRITRGDWLVTGSKAGRSTVFQILDRVATYDRVVLHIDELDKFNDLQNSDWGGAIASDLWNVLDGRYQIGRYFSETSFSGRTKPTAVQMASRVRSNLFVIGSGTWQGVFEQCGSSRMMGFQRSRASEPVDFARIAGAAVISPELLLRFNSEPLFLTYPAEEETRRILELTGITGLARQLGISVSADEIDWTRGGMRALETVATRIALASHQRRVPTQMPIPLYTDGSANCGA